MKHRKGQKVHDVFGSVAVAMMVAAGMSIMLSTDEAEGATASTWQVSQHMASCNSDEGAEGQSHLPCMWDADHQGNHLGSSYIMRRSGDVDRVTHKRAHRVWLSNGKPQ